MRGLHHAKASTAKAARYALADTLIPPNEIGSGAVLTACRTPAARGEQQLLQMRLVALGW